MPGESGSIEYSDFCRVSPAPVPVPSEMLPAPPCLENLLYKVWRVALAWRVFYLAESFLAVVGGRLESCRPGVVVTGGPPSSSLWFFAFFMFCTNFSMKAPFTLPARF